MVYILTMIGLTLNLQLLTVVITCILFNKNNITLLLLLKFLKKIPIIIFFKKINKILLFNKIAVVHILLYSLVLIQFYLFNYKSSIYFYKLQNKLVILCVLGILWSNSEVLWGGFWNWNITELSLLFVIIIIIFSFHYKTVTYSKSLNTLIIFFIYFLYNRLLLVLNIHSFTNNKYLKVSYIFIIIPIYLFIRFKNKIIILFLMIIWLIQIIQFNILVTKIYKLILIYLYLYILYYNINTSVIIQLNTIFGITSILSSFYKSTVSRFKNNNSYIVIKIHLLILLFLLLLLIQQTYYIISQIDYKSSYINIITGKSKFIFDGKYLVNRKILIWRYKIVTEVCNNNILHYYY